MSEAFHAQFGEDRWIAENLKLPDNGFYVDLGCAYPHVGSNTAFLRARGWQGLAVDGNDEFIRFWKDVPRTTFAVAVLAGDQTAVPFVVNRKNCWISRIERDSTAPLVPAVSLESLLSMHQIGKIDVLSIDLEGAEYNVLMTLSLRHHWPGIIISEFDTENIGEDWRVMDHLLNTGRYELVHTTRSNLIFQLIKSYETESR